MKGEDSEAAFFLLPLWEKVARTKSATDEGALATGLRLTLPLSALARPPSPT